MRSPPRRRLITNAGGQGAAHSSLSIGTGRVVYHHGSLGALTAPVAKQVHAPTLGSRFRQGLRVRVPPRALRTLAQRLAVGLEARPAGALAYLLQVSKPVSSASWITDSHSRVRATGVRSPSSYRTSMLAW